MKKLILLTLLLNLVINSTFSQAYEPSDSIKKYLEEVIVSPFSVKKKAPITALSISGKELLQKNYGQEPSLILSETPSITFYSDAGCGSGYSYFRLRGIDQTRINTTLNDVPLNEPEDQGAYFSNYPDFFESVSSLQIQRGAGFSKNGVASYAGSLNIESVLYKDSSGFMFSSNYGSFNMFRLNGAYNSGLKNRFGTYIRASHLHSDGYKDHSGNTSSSFFLNTGYWGEKHKIYLLSFAGKQQNKLAWIGSPLDSIKVNPRYNANTKAETDAFFQVHLQLHDNWKVNASNQLHSGVFFNYLDGNYNFDLNNFLSLPQTNELYNYAFHSYFTGIFSYHSYIKRNIKWYNGLQSQWYNRRHKGSEASLGELYTNKGFRNEASIFSKLQITIKKRITLLGDIQYRYSSFTYLGKESMPGQYWNFFNASAGVTYSLKNLEIYYSISKTQREPTRNDFFLGNDDLIRDNSGELLFNPLKPEQVIDHELGMRILLNKGHLFVNGYFMKFKNEITLNGQIGPTGLPLRSSTANSFRSGIELDALYPVSTLIVLINRSAISYNRINENEIKFQPVLTPSVIINQELKLIKPKWQAGMVLRYQNGSFINYANSYKLPSYCIVNIEGSWDIKKIVFYGAINNITSQKYYTNGLMTYDGKPAYFIQSSINYYLGFRIKWK